MKIIALMVLILMCGCATTRPDICYKECLRKIGYTECGGDMCRLGSSMIGQTERERIMCYGVCY